MLACVTVTDWELGGARHSVALRVAAETMTMRDFLRRRLETEAAEARQAAREGRARDGSRLDLWRVKAGAVEWALNGGPRVFGPSTLPRVDRADSVEARLRDIEDAFKSRSFVAVFDGDQIDDLDQCVTVRDDSQATFIRLVPLVGG